MQYEASEIKLPICKGYCKPAGFIAEIKRRQDTERWLVQDLYIGLIYYLGAIRYIANLTDKQWRPLRVCTIELGHAFGSFSIENIL